MKKLSDQALFDLAFGTPLDVVCRRYRLTPAQLKKAGERLRFFDDPQLDVIRINLLLAALARKTRKGDTRAVAEATRLIALKARMARDRQTPDFSNDQVKVILGLDSLDLLSPDRGNPISANGNPPDVRGDLEDRGAEP